MSVVRSLYRTILPPRLRAGLRHWRGVARRVAAGPIPGRPEAHTGSSAPERPGPIAGKYSRSE